MGSQCSCLDASTESHITLDTLTSKRYPRYSPDISTRNTNIQPASIDFEVKFADSLHISSASEESFEIDSDVLKLDSFHDPAVDIVLEAFRKYVARVMQLAFGKREVTRRRQSKAAQALFNMPQFDSGFEREDFENLMPIFLGDGAVYLGIASSNGKVTGYGIAYNPDGSAYEGDWKDGLYSGSGRLVYDEEHFYEGDFYEGRFEGTGTYWKEGFRYKGQWLSGFAHGTGIEVLEGKFTYEGEFCKGVKEGKGTMKFDEGGTYVGDFKANNFDGYGIRAWDDKLYSGNWLKGRKHGEGTLTYSTGEKYHGMFADDQKLETEGL